MKQRHVSNLDMFLDVIDNGLRTVFTTPRSQRDNPAQTQEDIALSEAEKRLSGRLMRINHAGEVAAQGLYQGQALTARLPDVREKMEAAAQEENDHLNWCATRIKELGTHTSYFDPFWYAGSVTIGALAGLAGDKWSLGFVAETEKQVVAHLQDHLQRVSPNDNKSRAIIEQMQIDEGKHATTAIESGGVDLPQPIRLLMKLTSKVMTRSAYWI
jgi:ubiquinone biosynthesis monooxygenase Coq7